MEECPPGGDYASGEGDPLKSDNPPASCTTNPVGEQDQGESVSRGDDVSQAASHSPELKRKKDSSTTSVPMTEWHQSALVALQGSLKLNVKMFQLSGMLERPAGGFMDRAEVLRVKAKTGDMEQIGELINILLGKEDMAFYTFCDLLQRSNYEVWAHELKSAAERLKTVGAPNEGGQTTRRISVSKTTAPGLSSVALPQSVSAEGSQTVSMMGASTVTTSGMAMAVNPSPDVSALNLESCEMDIVTCDRNVFESHKSPAEAIRSLYFNAYNHLIRILSTQCSAIKSVALSAVRTKQVSATEVEVKQACDLRALFECLDVDKKWNDLEFLSIAITSLPVESSKVKAAAQLVLGQYTSYLAHYMKAVSIKEGKNALSFLQRKRGREEMMVVTKVTVDKEFDEYVCNDLLHLWKLFLIETLEIPEERIDFRLARPGNSTTLVFMIEQTYAEGTKEKLFKPAAVWVMKELGILRVHVAGVVSMDLREVLPNVLIASIREGLQSGVDFVSLTKVISPLMCSLLDQVPEPKETQLSSIQPYSAGTAEQSVPEPVVEGAPSSSVVKDLLVAAAEGRLHEVQSLLDGGRCRVNDEDEEGFTAILKASLNGHLTVLQTLVEQYGGNLLHRKKGGLNAFHLSTVDGHVGVAQYLAPKMGVHMFDLTDEKDTALHWAVGKGHLPMVEHLVKSAGFDVKDKNKNGGTPFLIAAAMGHVEVASFLLDNGSSILERANSGRNAFLLCAMQGHLAVAEYLAPKMEGHLFDSDDEGSTALHLAAYFGQLSMVQYLVRSCGFDVKARDKVGFNAFHISAERGHVGVAQYLAPLIGVHMFDVTDTKNTALHIAAGNGHLPMVEHLVKSAGFDVKDKNKNGVNPFLVAAAMGHVKVADFLLDNGSSILERADGGQNAFHLCAAGSHLATAEYLVPKMEGHLFDSDDAGYTALHWAAQENQLPMVEYLVRSCGFDVKARDKWGYTPLLRAVVTGHADIARFLLASGSVFNERNNDGEPALRIAVREGHLDVVKVLVQAYRDLHVESEIDQYYMDLADDHHHEHVVEYLSSEFPSLKRKVPVPQPQPTGYPNVWSISGPTYPDH